MATHHLLWNGNIQMNVCPVARQEACSASHGQPCSYCQHRSAHSHFESMDLDTDTDSDLIDHDEDEEYHRFINNNDP
eukprot:12909530-Prorocentrum_lima.AAC.1